MQHRSSCSKTVVPFQHRSPSIHSDLAFQSVTARRSLSVGRLRKVRFTFAAELLCERKVARLISTQNVAIRVMPSVSALDMLFGGNQQSPQNHRLDKYCPCLAFAYCLRICPLALLDRGSGAG